MTFGGSSDYYRQEPRKRPSLRDKNASMKTFISVLRMEYL